MADWFKLIATWSVKERARSITSTLAIEKDAWVIDPGTVMKKGRRPDRKTAETLSYLWAAGLAITLGVAFGIYTINKYGELGRSNVRLLVETLALSMATTVLFVRYLAASHHELALLQEYFNPSMAPRLGPGVYYNVFLLALIFGVLIAMSHLILIYTALIIVLNLTDLWGGWQGRQKIIPVFEKKLSRPLSAKQREVIKVIRDHYLENPTLERVATIMFVNWLAFSVALVGYYEKKAVCRDIAYIIVILNISVGEYFIHRWRKRRDHKIDQLDPTTE